MRLQENGQNEVFKGLGEESWTLLITAKGAIDAA